VVLRSHHPSARTLVEANDIPQATTAAAAMFLAVRIDGSMFDLFLVAGNRMEL
jgi:hypothetical protein